MNNKPFVRNNLKIDFSPYGHEIMLSDNVRMETYSKAIEKHVKKGDIVLDLGAGTGILSFLAASKKPRKIYALERSKIIRWAELLAEENNIKNIDFVKIDSKNFTINEKVDVILQEQIGRFIFDDDMVGLVIDVRDRLLKKGGKILPNKFELFIVPVKIKDQFHVPVLWEFKINNIDFSPLKKLYKEPANMYRLISGHELDYFLCKPEKFCSFDLKKIKNKIPIREFHFKRKTEKTGRLDGFCIYLKVIFDEKISFTTSPLDRQTHWKTLLLRCESKKYKKGDLIEFELKFNDLLDRRKWEWVII